MQKALRHEPDGCFGLQDLATGKQECFFVELDRGTESGHKRWRQKVAAYKAYATQGFRKFHFNGKGFRVLTINRSQTDRRQLERTHNLVEHAYEAGGRKQFWFTPFDELMPEKRVTGEHVFAGDIWTRVNPDDEGRRLALADHLFDADRKSSVLQ